MLRLDEQIDKIFADKERLILENAELRKENEKLRTGFDGLLGDFILSVDCENCPYGIDIQTELKRMCFKNMCFEHLKSHFIKEGE